MVPCAQGRVVVETARPAPPHFATCSSYRRPIISSIIQSNIIASQLPTTSSGTHAAQQVPSASGKGAISRPPCLPAQSFAARPDDLGVTPWYFEEYSAAADNSPGPMGNRSSYPSHPYYDRDPFTARPELVSTRNSSIESEVHRPPLPPVSTVPRKAYMDLKGAIALLDETCPNQEPSPSLTPRTPRTPLTPHPRNKRARSKSSDNSSNYSNERLSDRSLDATKEREKEKEKKRPFLKKIGISKTEDKPFLAKLAPKIIGKPYLEKIGPSKAVERPFLEKIGSSKTLDKFTFDPVRLGLRHEQRSIAGSQTLRSVVKDQSLEAARELPKEEATPVKTQRSQVEERDQKHQKDRRDQRDKVVARKYATEKRRSGKEFLLKMYSFETEDLESTVQPKHHRDPLRGASLDDVLDSGPSSLPPLETSDSQTLKPELEKRPTSVAELVKCRVTTSEEIISSAHSSPKEANSWAASPYKNLASKRDTSTTRTPTHRKTTRTSQEALRGGDSTPNSPTKRSISTVSPDRQIASTSDSYERNLYSPTKTRRQTSDDLLDGRRREETERNNNKHAQFERRGISSDNLLSRDTSTGRQMGNHGERRRETASEDSLASRVPQYTKETFKQLQDKFRLHEIPTETYADFKRRTRGHHQHSLASTQDRTKPGITLDETKDVGAQDAKPKVETPSKSIGTKGQSKSEEETGSTSTSETVRSQGTVRSVLRKQEGVDNPSDQESDASSSLRRPKRRIFHEPSQETMDLLTELRKVKSLLKAPSKDKDLELDKKPARTPKRILLTDKEFCLSIERENSIRRLSGTIDLEDKDNSKLNGKQAVKQVFEGGPSEEDPETSNVKIPGPALFEKKCLSLDYADDERPQKPEIRTTSLASARNLTSVEATIEFSDSPLGYDSKSYSSEVFNTPSEKVNENQGEEEDQESEVQNSQNHCADVESAIDQIDGSTVQMEARSGELYEIISPRSTPFRAKKRLGKISVEESVKPESFTLGSKVDCRSLATQKRTKCFPL